MTEKVQSVLSVIFFMPVSGLHWFQPLVNDALHTFIELPGAFFFETGKYPYLV